MRFYEVSETIRPGFPVVQEEGHKPYVSMVAYDDEYGAPACLALGSSICRELKHPDDQKEQFRLFWGEYVYSTAGSMLIAQTREESDADNCALVMITRCYLPRIGITKIESADKYLKPEQLVYAQGDGTRRDLFIMSPGTGLFIKWDKRLLGSDHHLSFIIAWDAEKKELRMEEPVRKSPPSRAHRPRQEPLELRA
jgi:hypothetical protein